MKRVEAFIEKINDAVIALFLETSVMGLVAYLLSKLSLENTSGIEFLVVFGMMILSNMIFFTFEKIIKKICNFVLYYTSCVVE